MHQSPKSGVLERGHEEAGRQRVHDHGARLRRETVGQGGVGVVPAHEPFHRGGRTLRRGAFIWSVFEIGFGGGLWIVANRLIYHETLPATIVGSHEPPRRIGDVFVEVYLNRW